MNRLFIIGNGFDLNLNMKTSYKDFYNYYNTKENTKTSIKKLKENITENINNWSDLELEFGKYTERIESSSEFEEIYDDLVENLLVYLENEENNFDYSKFSKQKLLNFLVAPENSLLPADKNKLSTFQRTWNNVTWRTNIITFNYTQSLEEIIESPFKNTQLGTQSTGHKVILNDIHHIHGDLINGIVIGVNDISQLSNKSFHNNLDITESIIKKECNQARKHEIDIACEKLIEAANIIYIFGSSLGESDNIWWELICKQLKRINFKLVIFEKRNEINPKQGQKKMIIDRRIRETFLSRVEFTEEEKKNADNNLFIGINTELFKLV